MAEIKIDEGQLKRMEAISSRMRQTARELDAQVAFDLIDRLGSAVETITQNTDAILNFVGAPRDERARGPLRDTFREGGEVVGGITTAISSAGAIAHFLPPGVAQAFLVAAGVTGGLAAGSRIQQRHVEATLKLEAANAAFAQSARQRLVLAQVQARLAAARGGP